ncbi:hypothetical protein SADUNF_Sadunf11G0043500 [Salix dunnii]|uniref:non-specific serine/threonine protein kinase n=1 Tax=Salix dunnii TaxID=1413687 RepID=A0A835MNY7_9ROSI|nr:hypothetical protein SADUNF_Sadunf11G0043500 [Salix dunnii]
MEKRGPVVMNRYELGRLLGQGTFAKVYHARNLQSGQSVAIKIIDKEKVLRTGLMNQIKREISVMSLVRHPNIVQLDEVMASRTRIYFVMEFVKGGELFSLVARGKLKEDVARKYFQQLIGAIDFCHSRGVYHRDLKPENLLLDENGDLKITDFGLSALSESRRQDGLLHTTCGTPAYVAPEVINKKGYDGPKADIWSCGIILFVLLAGFLPFHDRNIMELYRKITEGRFRCPKWFHPEARKLLSRILDPHPGSRMSTEKIMKNCWFRKGYEQIETPPSPQGDARSSLIRDVHAAFDNESNSKEKSMVAPRSPLIPTRYNAFDIISLSEGFDLSGLFEKDKNRRHEARFTTTQPASMIMSKFEQIAMAENFSFKKKDGTLMLEGNREGRKGLLAIDAEICEVTPSFYVVELKKKSGDSFEYKEFCDHELKPSLEDIVWAWQGSEQPEV